MGSILFIIFFDYLMSLTCEIDFTNSNELLYERETNDLIFKIIYFTLKKKKTSKKTFQKNSKKYCENRVFSQ